MTVAVSLRELLAGLDSSRVALPSSLIELDSCTQGAEIWPPASHATHFDACKIGIRTL
jgi:hypothetical protein